jgi:HdeA/HdeB family
VWLSGYYHGKRGSTIVDTQTLLVNAKKAQDYCLKNPEMPLMTAVEKILGD